MRRYVRVSPRRDSCIQVTDSRSGHPMGRVGDLSLGGLRLVARQPLTIGDRYEMAVHVPERARRSRQVDVVVTCRWIKQDARLDSVEMGFALECPTPAFAELVQAQLSRRGTRRAFGGRPVMLAGLVMLLSLGIVGLRAPAASVLSAAPEPSAQARTGTPSSVAPAGDGAPAGDVRAGHRPTAQIAMLAIAGTLGTGLLAFGIAWNRHNRVHRPSVFSTRLLAPGARKAELRLADALFRNAREGIVIADDAGEILQVNPAFCRITGYNQHEVRGYRLQAFQSVLQPTGHCTDAWQALEEKDHWAGELRGRHKNGSEYRSHLSAQVVRDAKNRVRHHILFLSDSSSMELRQKRLERIAHYDALTQLPNRILLAERMDQALLRSKRYGKPLAIVFIDLDGFKPVNDNHGHEQGDRLLQIIGARLKATLRETDTLARFGGDEFVALLTDLQLPDDCQSVLERMIAAASEPLMIGDVNVRLSASIGVALAPLHGEAGEALIEKADQAMYRAKRAGGNRYVFSDESVLAVLPEPGADPLSAAPVE